MLYRLKTARRSRLAAIGCSLLLALAVAPGLATRADAQAPAPVSGGTMTIINGSDITSWDPAVTRGTFPGGPMDVLDSVYGFLVYIDTEGKVTGGMAESLTSTDAVNWTLKLRKGVTFSDGNPYDAEAVKFNWDRAADPATLAPTQAWVSSWNKGISVVDPLTLSVKLPAPNANFAAQVAELAPFVASPAALKAAEKKTDIKPVGAGAFLLQSWNQSIGMTLTRNPKYWDQPRPYLETLKFAVIPETNSRIATVVQGGATMMAGYMFQFGNNATAPGVGTVKVPMRGIYRAYFNQVKGPFTDVRAREAFYLAIDRARLMQALTQTGGYKPPKSFFGETSPWFDPAFSLPAADPKKAQELFNALKADGKPFDIKVVTYTNSDLKRLGAYVQQVLSGYDNVKATLVEVEQANHPTRCKTQLDFDVCFEGGVVVSNGAEPVISNLMSSKGSFNWGQYKSEAMDAALAEANSTVNPAGIKAAYSKVQKLVATEYPFYIFGEETRFLLVRNNTGGVVPSNGGILQKQFLFVCPDACVK